MNALSSVIPVGSRGSQFDGTVPRTLPVAGLLRDVRYRRDNRPFGGANGLPDSYRIRSPGDRPDLVIIPTAAVDWLLRSARSSG